MFVRLETHQILQRNYDDLEQVTARLQEKVAKYERLITNYLQALTALVESQQGVTELQRAQQNVKQQSNYGGAAGMSGAGYTTHQNSSLQGDPVGEFNRTGKSNW